MTDDLARLKQALAARYAVDRAIGSGGMATVYLARDLKHDRSVAIKVLRPELAHALGPERFLREIRLTAQLDHSHILPLLDSGDADGLLYYVMPFVEGESLRDRLNRRRGARAHQTPHRAVLDHRTGAAAGPALGSDPQRPAVSGGDGAPTAGVRPTNLD